MDSTVPTTLRHQVVFTRRNNQGSYEPIFIASRSTQHVDSIPDDVDCFEIQDVLESAVGKDGTTVLTYSEPTNVSRVIICRACDQLGLLIDHGWWELPKHEAVERMDLELLSHKDFNIQALTSIEDLAKLAA